MLHMILLNSRIYLKPPPSKKNCYNYYIPKVPECFYTTEATVSVYMKVNAYFHNLSNNIILVTLWTEIVYETNFRNFMEFLPNWQNQILTKNALVGNSWN